MPPKDKKLSGTPVKIPSTLLEAAALLPSDINIRESSETELKPKCQDQWAKDEIHCSSA